VKKKNVFFLTCGLHGLCSSSSSLLVGSVVVGWWRANELDLSKKVDFFFFSSSSA